MKTNKHKLFLFLLISIFLISCFDTKNIDSFINEVDKIENVTFLDKEKIETLLLIYDSFSIKEKDSVNNAYQKLQGYKDKIDEILAQMDSDYILELYEELENILKKSELTNEDKDFIIDFIETIYNSFSELTKKQFPKYEQIYQLYLSLKENESEERVLFVIHLINELPEVISINDEQKLNNATTHYYDLLNSEKEEVSNIDKLLRLLDDLTDIKNNLASEERVNNIISLIGELPNTILLNDENKLKNVLNQYNQLTKDEKEKVSNSNKLFKLLDDLENLKSQMGASFGIEKIGLEYEDRINWNGTDKSVANSITLLIYNIYQNQEISNDLILPSNFMDDEHVTFRYVSFSTSYLNNDGTLVRLPILREQVSFSVYVNYWGSESDARRIYIYLKGTGTPIQYIEEGVLSLFEGGVNTNVSLPLSYRRGIYQASLVWQSSDESLLTSTGNYTKPSDDVWIKLFYKITLEDDLLEGEIDVLIKGPSDMERAIAASLEIESLYASIKEVSDDIVLITELASHPRVQIIWFSDNEGVLSSSGVYSAPIDTMFITLRATLVVNKTSVEVEFSMKVSATKFNNKWEAIEVFLNNIHKPTIGNISYNTFGYQAGYLKNLQKEYGYIYFFENVKPTINERIIPLSMGNRPGTKLASVQYVTVHDTASAAPNANGEAHAKYVETGAGQELTSWHYTVANDGIFHHLPNDEVGWHAGDGSVYFGVNDTDVKATTNEAVVGVNSQKRVYTINGIDSKIAIPTSTPASFKLPTQGFFTQIGSNGNWYLGNTWWSSTYATICNGGGNRNSIGIETCVDYGSDYTQTMRYLAKLVGNLCYDNKLSVDRVKQHNYFSGKDCPMTLRHAGRWTEFINLVRLELFALNELEGVSFKWTSLSPSIMSNNGKIINHADGAVVNYKVDVTYLGETRTYNFSSTLSPFSGIVIDIS
jgi:N-acetylmuramoyl-L-alanine amidase CwlA